ncbi:MAG: family 16 glycoside hydrolase [Phycisphaerales bacterium JB047]
MKLFRDAMAVLFLFTPLTAISSAQETDPGVTFRVYAVDGNLQQIPEIAPDQTPNLDELRDSIDADTDDFGGIPLPYVTHVTAELLIKEPGEYAFMLTSDDGSRLTLNGEVLIDHDGLHGAIPKTSERVFLEQGAHLLRVDHFEAGGASVLKLEWIGPNDLDYSVISSENLRTQRDLTRVTSPGVKQIIGQNRPGDRRALNAVHPGWDLSTIRPEGFEPKVGAMCFLPDGRLAIGTFDPLQRDDRSLPDIDSKEPDKLFAILNWDAEDQSKIEVVEIATDLYEPSAMCVHEGELYVAHRKKVERLRDNDNDGYFETHELIADGWEGWNYHQFVFGLTPHNGKLYAALSTAMAPPAWEGMQDNAGPNGPMRGGLIEIDIESKTAFVIAGGLRTPNGLGVSPDGALVYLDNQGTWMPTSTLAEIIPGRFYGHYNNANFVPNLKDRFPDGGHPSVYADRPRTPPALWLPQNEVVNSPTQPLPITSGPFKGQMLVGELTAGGVRRVFLERVNGQLQGALFRFTQGLESGVNRMAWAPDGSLIVAGIGAGGNWNWRGTQFGLQRLKPNGKAVFEYQSVQATPEGFRITFTEPVDRRLLSDPRSYNVESWYYKPTTHYGGPKIDERPNLVFEAIADSDGRAVTLRLGAFAPGRVYHIVSDLESRTGEPIWSTEAWYTLNQIPRADATEASRIGDIAIETDAIGVGVLPPADAVTLIANNSAAAMRYANRPFPGQNMTQDDHINASDYLTVGDGSGDLASTTLFGDARIHIEWLSPRGGAGQMAGNSGVYLQGKYELQVLGTKRGDSQPAMNEAGAFYNIKAADHNASNGPGQWQAYDIWFRAPRFDRDGNKISDARATVYWNGTLIHDDVELPHPTGSQQANGEAPGNGLDYQIGPLVLQDHASAAEGPVRYRNAWIAPLKDHEPTPGPWVNLFEDTSADDWIVRGGHAPYTMEDGVLTGTSVPNSRNSFYTTVKEYSDFELIYEVRVHPELNSGVQIRSHVIDGFDNRNGGLRGYQIEVDPAARAYTAGIYDEARRGWLHPMHTTPSPRRAFRAGEWNTIRVVANGPIIRTWINGVPAAEIFDAMTASGHIGFQVHDVGGRQDPLTVEFRNARIRELD